MSIIKEILLDSGVTVAFHRIGRVAFTNTTLGVRASILVSSWVSQSQFDSGIPEIHSEVLQDVELSVGSNIFESVEYYLITNDSSKYCQGSITTDNITIPIDALKSTRWNIIKGIRDKVEKTTFVWNSHVFDSKDSSQIKLTLAAVKAIKALQLNESYSEYWTLANDSILLLSAEQIVQVTEALGDHIRSTHTTGTYLRMAIDAATTEEEVMAISWPI